MHGSSLLAKMGHQVKGVDINPKKVRLLNAGKSPIIEKGLMKLIKQQVAKRRIRAFHSVSEAIRDTDISFVCVGTPSYDNGNINLDPITKLLQEIGEVIRKKNAFHIIVIRSTVYPGSIEEKFIPVLEKASGKKCDVSFGIAMSPEFTREGTSVKDYFTPPPNNHRDRQ